MQNEYSQGEYSRDARNLDEHLQAESLPPEKLDIENPQGENGLILPGEAASSIPVRGRIVGRCKYCGAKLDAGFYFCLSCAMPFQHVENLLSRPVDVYKGEGTLIQERAPKVWPLFWSYVAVLVFGGIFCRIAFGNRIDMTMLVMEPLIIALTLFFAYQNWPSLSVQFKMLGLLNPWTLAGILALAPLLTASYGFHQWLASSGVMSGNSQMDAFRKSGISHSGLVLLICISPAIIEEIAFRGLLQHWLQVALPPMRAIVIASALFAALHFSIVSAPFLFGAGFIMGWVKWKTGSLYPAMLIHFLHNFIVLEMF